MELLLNILWLLLVLPAFWVWHDFVSGKQAGRIRAASSVVLLGCVLALLFPVVSATDDLHAMRSEMEESSPGKRVVKLAAPSSQASLTGFCALPSCHLDSPDRNDSIQGQVLPSMVPHLLEIRFQVGTGRAPPSTINS